MKTENQNKLLGELAALNKLPKNIYFNATDTWVKIEQQLKPKRKNKYYWLWVAASAIIAITTTWLSIDTNKETKTTVEKTDNKQTQQIVVIAKKKTTHTNKELVKKAIKKQSPTSSFVNTIDEGVLEKNIDTAQPMIAEQKTITIPPATIVIAKPVQIRKKLKVVYAIDLYEENNRQITQQEIVKEQPKKSFFKLFESQNREQEETTTTENQPQPSKTFLGFKSKPTATISINENQ